MEVIPIDCLQLAAFAIWPCLTVAYVYVRKRNMKMANSPENGLVSTGAAVR